MRRIGKFKPKSDRVGRDDDLGGSAAKPFRFAAPDDR